MASLRDLRFDTAGWTAARDDADVKAWRRETGDVLSAHFFDLAPDISAPLEDLDGIRAMYREMLTASGAALVSADVLDAAGVSAVQLVCKAPQKPSGMTYIGSLTLPFAAFSFVLKVQSFEVGMTGLRDTIVFARSGIAIEGGTAPGWAQDPYDPSYRAPLLRNLADDERWDEQFPDHPLSRARKIIRHLVETARLDERVLQAPRFTGPTI